MRSAPRMLGASSSTAVTVRGFNLYDHRCRGAMDAISPIKRSCGRSGRPRKRPRRPHADEGYDFPAAGRY